MRTLGQILGWVATAVVALVVLFYVVLPVSGWAIDHRPFQGDDKPEVATIFDTSSCSGSIDVSKSIAEGKCVEAAPITTETKIYVCDGVEQDTPCPAPVKDDFDVSTCTGNVNVAESVKQEKCVSVEEPTGFDVSSCASMTNVNIQASIAAGKCVAAKEPEAFECSTVIDGVKLTPEDPDIDTMEECAGFIAEKKADFEAKHAITDTGGSVSNNSDLTYPAPLDRFGTCPDTTVGCNYAVDIGTDEIGVAFGWQLTVDGNFIGGGGCDMAVMGPGSHTLSGLAYGWNVYKANESMISAIVAYEAKGQKQYGCDASFYTNVPVFDGTSGDTGTLQDDRFAGYPDFALTGDSGVTWNGLTMREAKASAGWTSFKKGELIWGWDMTYTTNGEPSDDEILPDAQNCAIFAKEDGRLRDGRVNPNMDDVQICSDQIGS